ncbi:efflux RND transporter periplasmic adaptor subunit [Lederbergia lenta]|nr:efflux RND transporter periplasmic adaptor subunit [Lederbergia lenta]MEC2323191.1 efflux RND transporter periplasmic adaptor subunit [Lederbergia lenta]
MNRRWMWFLGTTSFIVIIGLNIFLMEKENSKVDRLNYVVDWKRVTAGDVVETTATEGVIVPMERHPIFIDPHTEFSEFFVKKGDQVDKGTPLFAYASDNLEQQIALLDAEISSLLTSKDHINAFIQNLEGMKYALPLPVSSSYFGDEQVDVARQAHEEAMSMRVLSVSIDQAIAEKELEKDKVDQDIKKYEDQRRAIENGRSGLTVLSSHAGIVEDISFALDNPVITIISETTVMEGKVSEEQMKVVQEGMKANITSSLFNGRINGEIHHLERLPIDQPHIDKDSAYRFLVDLGDHEKELNIGYHVEAEIVTAEARDVPVVETESIQGNQYMWMLNDRGMTEKRPIEPGLKVKKRHEVKNGVSLGEFYVLDQREVDYEARFITPFKMNKLTKTTWKEASTRKIIKYMLIGLLQR